MKVQELRDLLKAAERAHLEKAFIESYKALRKTQKEEIDPIIKDLLEGKAVERNHDANRISFPDLKEQIITFIDNAYAQNYLVPNRVVPKSQRSKWRFQVKNNIKELNNIPLHSDHYTTAVQLLTALY